MLIRKRAEWAWVGVRAYLFLFLEGPALRPPWWHNQIIWK
jgi:hypothetical protein